MSVNCELYSVCHGNQFYCKDITNVWSFSFLDVLLYINVLNIHAPMMFFRKVYQKCLVNTM